MKEERHQRKGGCQRKNSGKGQSPSCDNVHAEDRKEDAQHLLNSWCRGPEMLDPRKHPKSTIVGHLSIGDLKPILQHRAGLDPHTSGLICEYSVHEFERVLSIGCASAEYFFTWRNSKAQIIEKPQCSSSSPISSLPSIPRSSSPSPLFTDFPSSPSDLSDGEFCLCSDRIANRLYAISGNEVRCLDVCDNSKTGDKAATQNPGIGLRRKWRRLTPGSEEGIKGERIRAKACLAPDMSCIYRIGGLDVHKLRLDDRMHRFDLARRTWQDLPGKMSALRYDFGMCVSEDGRFIFIIGGYTRRAIYLDVFSSVEYYDTKTGHWGELATMHEARAAPSVFTSSNGRYLHVLGGFNRAGVVRSAESYDFSLGRWSKETRVTMEHWRYEATAVVSGSGDRVYIVGGKETFDLDSQCGTVESFCIEDGSFYSRTTADIAHSGDLMLGKAGICETFSANQVDSECSTQNAPGEVDFREEGGLIRGGGQRRSEYIFGKFREFCTGQQNCCIS